MLAFVQIVLVAMITAVLTYALVGLVVQVLQ
jgi:hypothetical protein